MNTDTEGQESNPTNQGALLDGVEPGKPRDLPESPPPAAPLNKGRWLSCLLGGVLVMIILAGAIFVLTRVFSSSLKRIVAVAPPGAQVTGELPEGLNLRLPKGLTPTPAFTAPPSPSATRSPTPTETSTRTPSPTPIPAFDWNTQVLQHVLAVGAFTSLDIDRQGSLHLVYFQDNNDMIWYAHNSSGDWQFEKVLGEVGHGFHLSMVLDAQDHPHLAYFNIKSGRTASYLWYRSRSDSGWSSLFREKDYTVHNSDVSMDLGPDGKPYFIYQAGYDYSLMVAQFDPAVGFTSQKVADASSNCQALPIVVDSKGNPHVCFCALQGLVYAYRQGEDWHLEVVDPKPETGTYADLALDAQGRPHIAYYDPEYGILNYARRTGDGWQVQEVDTDEDTGLFPSIAVDPQGRVHISYYDVTRTALRYAFWDGETWELQTVDRKGDVGQYNSLALDPVSGAPRISYYDADREDLKIAWATWR